VGGVAPVGISILGHKGNTAPLNNFHSFHRHHESSVSAFQIDVIQHDI
jgi:hypothetical protein